MEDLLILVWLNDTVKYLYMDHQWDHLGWGIIYEY